MSEKKVLLELRGVKTFFPVRGGFFNKVRDHVQAVNDVDLDIYKGETLGLVGESGCGKTTLGKSIIQLVKATDGTMMYDFGPQHGGKKDLRHLNREDEQVLHRRIQIVFQDPYSSLMLLCKQAAKNFHTICKKETALKRVLSNLLSAVSLLRFKAVFSCGFRVPPGSGLYQSCAAGSVCIPAGQKYCSPRPRKSCPADRKTPGLPSRCIDHRW